jgi:hypothetical protein
VNEKASQAAVGFRPFVRKVNTRSPRLSPPLPPPSLAPIHSRAPLARSCGCSPSSPLSLCKESSPYAHKHPLYEKLRQQPHDFTKGAPKTGFPCKMKLSGIGDEVFFFLAICACGLLSVGASAFTSEWKCSGWHSGCGCPSHSHSRPGGGPQKPGGLLSVLEELCGEPQNMNSNKQPELAPHGLQLAPWI